MHPYNRTINEQRLDIRMENDQPIAFSLFNSRQRLVEHPCRTHNQSDTGMCFESFQLLHPGMVLCLLDDQDRPSRGTNIRSGRETALAEVKWCQSTQGDPGSMYKVGVRFF